ncbi:hypothetical protein [Roseobacter fucihabitans]|nr:hypothetical protein [Roseobacter litoralis]
MASVDPSALQSPLVDQLSLVSNLSSEGQTKLLRALLTTGPSLFKSNAQSGKSLEGFDRIIKQLLSSLCVSRLPLKSFRAVGKDARVLSYVMPADADDVALTDLVQVTAGRVKRISKFNLMAERDAKGVTLHLVLSEPIAPDATLIGVSDKPLHLMGPTRDEDLRPLQPWLDRQGAPVQRYMIDVLKKLCSDDPMANSLYQELRCAARDKPQLNILHAARCGDGLLYMIKAQDPRGLLSNARWVCEDIELDVPLDRAVWHPTHGDVHVGYLRGFQLTDPLPKTFHLWGEMRSRRAFLAQSVEPHEFDGRIPEIYEHLENKMVDRMLGQALAASLQGRSAPRATVDWFGTRPAAPKTRLIVCVNQTFDHPRALLTQLAQEPGADGCVTYLVASDPAQRSGLRRIAEDMNAVTGCTVAVVVFDAVALPSERLRAVLTLETAEATIVFPRAWLPKTSGWLKRWHTLVASQGEAQTARIAGGGGEYLELSPGRCQIFNQAAVEFFVGLPLRSASVEADLNGINEMSGAAVPETESAICYETASAMSNTQRRADAEAVAHLAQRAE